MNKQVSLDMFRKNAEFILEMYIGLPESITKREGRKGGYLTIKSAITGDIKAIYLIGSVPSEKMQKYIAFSQEKANRLFELRKKGRKHITSWESRNTRMDQYGGAILYDTRYISSEDEFYILSFSGLPELADEACMFMLQALLPSSGSVDSCTSDILHSVYLKKINRPGQLIYRALAKEIKIKI